MLNKNILKNTIKNYILGGSTDVDASANAWADAYDAYANGMVSYAQDQSGDRVITVNKTALIAGLKTAFTNGTAAGSASGIASAVLLYWTGGIFGILMPPTIVDPLAISDVSAVVINPGTGLASALQTEFSNLSTDADAKAEAIATVFDNNAKTVQVLCNYLKTNVVPPPPFLPGVATLSVS